MAVHRSYFKDQRLVLVRMSGIIDDDVIIQNYRDIKEEIPDIGDEFFDVMVDCMNVTSFKGLTFRGIQFLINHEGRFMRIGKKAIIVPEDDKKIQMAVQRNAEIWKEQGRMFRLRYNIEPTVPRFFTSMDAASSWIGFKKSFITEALRQNIDVAENVPELDPLLKLAF